MHRWPLSRRDIRAFGVIPLSRSALASGNQHRCMAAANRRSVRQRNIAPELLGLQQGRVSAPQYLFVTVVMGHHGAEPTGPVQLVRNSGAKSKLPRQLLAQALYKLLGLLGVDEPVDNTEFVTAYSRKKISVAHLASQRIGKAAYEGVTGNVP